MRQLGEWIRTIASVMVAASVLTELSAGAQYRKYIRLFTGILLILLVVSPMLRIFGDSTGDPMQVIAEEYDQMEEVMQKKIREMEQDIVPEIEEEEESYEGKESESGRIEVEQIRISR